MIKIKKKCLYAILFCALSSFVGIFAAYNIHFFIVNKSLCGIDFFKILASFGTDEIRRLFFLIFGFNLLLLFYLMVGQPSSKKGRVKDITVTPQIKTPEPADNTLYGSAKWLSKKDFTNIFKCINLKEHPLYKDLMKRGDNK